MNAATRGLWRYVLASWGVEAFLEIARHAQDRHPVSMKQKIAERKRLKCVIRRHFRKRIIPKN